MKAAKLFVKFYSFFGVAIFLSIIIVPLFVSNAAGITNISYRLFGNNASLEAFRARAVNNVDYESVGICFTNSSVQTYFVPNKTRGEWTPFYNKVLTASLPGVTIKNICVNGYCDTAGGETCANSSDCVSGCVYYHLDYSSGLNGSLTGSTSQIVAPNGNGTAVNAVPAWGFMFTGWTDGSQINPRTDLNVTANHAFTANYAADPCSFEICDTACPQYCTNNYTVITDPWRSECDQNPCFCGGCSYQCPYECPGGYFY